jgi:hypothetical protein
VLLPATTDLVSRHREAIIEGNVGLFVVGDLKQKEGYSKWVGMIQGCRERIIHACTSVERPFVARVGRSGKLWEIKRVLPHQRDEDVTAEIEAKARGFGIE